MNERKYTRGEIYYIKLFPTTGHEQRSGRPAVIVSNNDNNANSGVLEVCYLTLKHKKDLPTHVTIPDGPCANSTILCEQITSVAVDKVGDYLCFVPDDIMDEVDKALAVSLGLSLAEELPLRIDSISTPFVDQIKALKYENSKLSEELALAKDANTTIKENAVSFKKELDSANARADMYERMYNDLLDRLMNRGRA